MLYAYERSPLGMMIAQIPYPYRKQKQKIYESNLVFILFFCFFSFLDY